MEAQNGVVFRTTRRAFEQDQRIKCEAILRAEIGQLKAEHAGAKAERTPKLQSKIWPGGANRESARMSSAG